MLEKLSDRNTWISTLKYFLFFSLFYFIIKYILKDQEQNFFSSETFTDIIRFSLIMSLLFLFTQRVKMKRDENEEPEKIPAGGFRYYTGFFLFLSIILIVLGSVILVTGLAVFKLLSDEPLSANHILKPMLVLVSMALVLTIFTFFSYRIKQKKL